MHLSSAWILSATKTIRTIFPTLWFVYFTLPGRYSGASYADFLLGLPQTTGLSNPAPSSYLRGTMWNFYAQDQYKVSQRLTLSYGVRWELAAPYHDKFARTFNYSPSAGALVVPNSGIQF